MYRKMTLLNLSEPTFQQISRTFKIFEHFDDLDLEGHDLEGQAQRNFRKI